MSCVGGPVGKEDSIVGVDEGIGVVQSDLVCVVVLTVSVFVAEEPALESMGICVVCMGIGFELVECMRMWVGVHQRLQ